MIHFQPTSFLVGEYLKDWKMRQTETRISQLLRARKRRNSDNSLPNSLLACLSERIESTFIVFLVHEECNIKGNILCTWDGNTSGSGEIPGLFSIIFIILWNTVLVI